MEKVIESIFNSISHLLREIQIYLFSGLVVAANILMVDHFYFNSSFWRSIKNENLFIPIFIVIYIIGQFCMSFYYVVLEHKKFDKKINHFFAFKHSVKSSSLPKIYLKNPDIYKHFVERYNILTMMR